MSCVSPMANADRRTATILVVEDEFLVRLSLADELREHGYAVIEAATKDVFHCTLSLDANDPLSVTPGLQTRFAAFANVAKTAAMHTLAVSNTESRLSLDALKDVIRRLSVAPGERAIVMASPGFLTTETEYDVSEVIDRALRANVIIGTLDARGFYAPLAGPDATLLDRIRAGTAKFDL